MVVLTLEIGWRSDNVKNDLRQRTSDETGIKAVGRSRAQGKVEAFVYEVDDSPAQIHVEGNVRVTLVIFSKHARDEGVRGPCPARLWPALNMGEVAIMFCFIFLYLAFAGAGAWALDNVLRPSTRQASLSEGA